MTGVGLCQVVVNKLWYRGEFIRTVPEQASSRYWSISCSFPYCPQVAISRDIFGIVMATQLDLPLPEITVENFWRDWTRFELVAAAKDWNANKRKVVLPTLLRGKLVDIYTTLDEETRGDLQCLKKELMTQAGLLRDPLAAAQSFMSRCQKPCEKVNDFVSDLRKLFVEAYPREEVTSTILLQRFVTGLLPAISRQLLLKGKPAALDRAIADTGDIEFALTFESPHEDSQDVNVVQRKPPVQTDSQKLQSVLDQVTKRLEALETKVQTTPKPAQQYNPQPPRPARQRSWFNNADRVCWLCGEVGHIRRECPLNTTWPARSVGSWPRR